MGEPRGQGAAGVTAASTTWSAEPGEVFGFRDEAWLILKRLSSMEYIVVMLNGDFGCEVMPWHYGGNNSCIERIA